MSFWATPGARAAQSRAAGGRVEEVGMDVGSHLGRREAQVLGVEVVGDAVAAHPEDVANPERERADVKVAGVRKGPVLRPQPAAGVLGVGDGGALVMRTQSSDGLGLAGPVEGAAVADGGVDELPGLFGSGLEI